MARGGRATGGVRCAGGARRVERRVRKRGPRAVSQGVATQRLGPTSRLRVVDAILSVTHEPGSRHYELLRAFADEATLRRADRQLEAGGYRTHEFGDSVLIERRARPVRRSGVIGRPRSCAGTAGTANVYVASVLAL